MPTKKKATSVSWLDRPIAPTTAAYAVINKCWSKKNISGYFSPDGELYPAPSGLYRGNGRWVSHNVDNVKKSFPDKDYGGYKNSYIVALEHHLTLNPSLVPHRRRKSEERVTKKIPTGTVGVFVQPPKDRSAPLNSKNCWRVLVSDMKGKLKKFSTPVNAYPGTRVFDDALLTAIRYRREIEFEYMVKNAFHHN